MAELLERISSKELSEWMAYYQLEPFGQERDNLHAGIVTAAVYNVNRDPKKHPETVKPEEFMLKVEQELTEEEQQEKAKTLYAGFRAWAVRNTT